MSHRILLAPQAEGQLRDSDNWWRENRPASPDLLLEEFERALDLLRVIPAIGSSFARAVIPGVRRLLLRRVEHWVYYLTDDTHQIVYILAVWGARRGTDPGLKEP